MDRIKAHRSAPTVYDPPTFEQMADYIQELTLQLLATSGQAADALDKLTKALEERDEYKAAAEICGKAARAMLAELEVKE
jgi:hypothetical protein